MKTITYILTILTFILSNHETEACTCIGKNTVKNELKETDVVFTGTITESQEIRIYDTLSPNMSIHRVEMKYTVIVETIYKGRQFGDTAYIFTGSGSGDCGFNFQIGQTYIVYAGHLRNVGRYSEPVFIDNKHAFNTNICTRTREYDEQEVQEIQKHLKKRRSN